MAKKKNPLPKRPKGNPKFAYTSTCCGLKASKEPLVSTPEAEGTLGKFRCTQCNKKCKCSRALYKEEKHGKEDANHNLGGSDSQVGQEVCC